MITTWNQKLYHAVRSYVNKDLLDETRVQVLKRTLYFGQFKWTLHFSPTVTNWTDFQMLLDKLTSLTKGMECRLVSSRQALYFNLYGNDPRLLTLVRTAMGDELEFSSIRIVSPDCWHLDQARPKNKGKFYHKFSYRIKITDSSGMTPEEYNGIMTGGWLTHNNYFYCDSLRDVIMFKLIHSSDIIDISERG